MAKAKQKLPPKLVFYDLEWTQNEIIQIGAVCGNADFSQCIRPSGRIDPFVRKKIQLDVRKDPTGVSQVYDLVRKQFLHTVNPREGFEKFLNWLEEVSEGCDVLMISHGNADILVLDRNLARYELDTRLYKIVTKYVDFQKYVTSYFKDISHLSLLELVKIFCNDQIFRLHCADEDSKALMSVFNNLHQMRGVPASEYMKNIAKVKKVYIRSIPIPKNSKEIKEIANHLNPGSKYVLLPSIFGVYNIFVASPLFRKIEPPENFKFEVSGYCVCHITEKYVQKSYDLKRETEYKDRTKMELACHIGNAYFILTHYIQANAKSKFNLLRKIEKPSSAEASKHKRNDGNKKSEMITLTAGDPVSVVILVTSTNYVKIDDLNVNNEKKPVDIIRILTDLQKKQSNLKESDGWGSCSSGSSDSFKSKPADNNGQCCSGRNRYYNNSSKQSQEVVETETDSTILNRRKKQIDYCKKTEDYKVYVESVPKQSRRHSMPKTPDMNRKYSRRQWDGAVKRWKTNVHAVGRDIANKNNQSTSNSNKNNHQSTSNSNKNNQLSSSSTEASSSKQ